MKLPILIISFFGIFPAQAALKATKGFQKLGEEHTKALEKPKQPIVKPKSAPTVSPQARLDSLEDLSKNPEKSREILAICEQIRVAFASNPIATQKMEFYRAQAFAQCGKWKEANESFHLAESAQAPDKKLAIQAKITHANLLLWEPNQQEQTSKLLQQILTQAAPDSLHACSAKFLLVCLYWIQAKSSNSFDMLTSLQEPIQKIPASREKDELAKKITYFDSALKAERNAKNTQNPVHVFYAPWRGKNLQLGLSSALRTADLAFFLRDFSKASYLYQTLEKSAIQNGQPDVQAWAYMQLARLTSFQKENEQAEKMLSRFLSTAPYKDATCAPYAILRLGFLRNNSLRNPDQAEAAFLYGSTKFKTTSEGQECAYYYAALPYLRGNPKASLSRIENFIQNYPNFPQSRYFKEQLLPEIHQQLASKKNRPNSP